MTVTSSILCISEWLALGSMLFFMCVGLWACITILQLGVVCYVFCILGLFAPVLCSVRAHNIKIYEGP